MVRRTALAKIADLATNDVLPFAQRMLASARRSADEAALKLLGAEFDQRVQQVRERYEALGGDPFGYDADVGKYAAVACSVLHRWYFRTEVRGIDEVPRGRCLLIANHSGQVPIDAAIIATAMYLDCNPPRMTRAMVEKWAMTLPFVSTFFSRVGQVVGVPENARRLLEMEELLLVFPEGTRGISKPFTRRYQLEEFGLGFMRLAMETRTPIVPVAVIGAEEQYINLGNLEWAARAFGTPVFPVVPQFFAGGVPLPVKYRLHFGEAMHFDGDHDDDDAVIEEKVWIVKQTIQSMLNRGVKERKSLFT
jgi:1-acyl-sn-glycerol-3-phosphate acyltransferase